MLSLSYHSDACVHHFCGTFFFFFFHSNIPCATALKKFRARSCKNFTPQLNFKIAFFSPVIALVEKNNSLSSGDQRENPGNKKYSTTTTPIWIGKKGCWARRGGGAKENFNWHFHFETEIYRKKCSSYFAEQTPGLKLACAPRVEKFHAKKEVGRGWREEKGIL